MRQGFGRLYNQHNEILAEGHCQVDDDRGSITMHPVVDSPTLQRERGPLRLVLDDAEDIMLTDKVIRFRLNLPNMPAGVAYRLYFADKPSAPRAEGTGV